jgi:DNA-binding MarR family transcriptional regulator
MALSKLAHKANRPKRGAAVASAARSPRTAARKQIAEPAAQSPDDAIALGDLAPNLGYRIRRAQLWTFREISRELAPFEMGPAQFSVLTIIDANPGINQLTVASALSIERAGLGRLIDRLEQQGLVTRAASLTNRRYYVLALTTAGATLLKRLRQHIAQCEDALAEKIGRRAYQKLLQTLSVFLRD